jgi:uncharacterized protein
MNLSKITLAVLLAMSSQAHAATGFSSFTALPASAGATATPATPITFGNSSWTQVSINDSASMGLVNVAPDMIASNETGPDANRYLFMPYEQGPGGVKRIDLTNNTAVNIVTPNASTNQGFASGDASRWTPWGGYLTGEESWGIGSTKGRLFEITNPTTATAGGANFVVRTVVPRVAHEGLAFDNNKAMYFVDELNGGSVYKFVSANPNATDGNGYFAAGQTFALNVGTLPNPYNEGNNGPAITGASSWVALTDANGAALNSAAVLGDGTVDGRKAADLAGVISLNRPEDMDIVNLANGNQALIFATTDSDNNGSTTDGRSRVYLNNLTTGQLSLFADSNTIDLATGLAVGGGFRNADNLAIDADGNIYIVEDRDGAVDDDIWFANDLNHDGDLLDSGEGLKRWATNGTPGSEFTGLYFSKSNPNVAFVNIQHPSDGVDRTIMITVPEADSYAMLLAGLGVMGFIARRRSV